MVTWQCSLRTYHSITSSRRIGIHHTRDEQGRYDSALAGFFLSHLIEDQDKSFFNILKRVLKPNGRFIIIDSIWNDERAVIFNKSGIVKRTLNDGREFEIYKRYFEKKDFDLLAEEHKINFNVVHEGIVFIAAVGNVA